MLSLFRHRLETLRTLYYEALDQTVHQGHYAEAVRVQAKIEILNQIIEECHTIILGRLYYEREEV